MTEPEPKHTVQNRWIVYDSVEHEFSVYYDEQEARKEYMGRIKQINDDVGNDEYEGDEEVYLAQVIEKAEVVQVGVADDGDEGLYQLVSYDYSAKSSDKVLEELIAHFGGFENQKEFRYSASDIIQYLTNFKKLVELRQQEREP